MLLAPALAHAQPGTVTGKVTGPDGKPLPYANVIVTGTTMGTAAAANGTYKLALPPASYRLKVAVVSNEGRELTAGRQLPPLLFLAPRTGARGRRTAKAARTPP